MKKIISAILIVAACYVFSYAEDGVVIPQPETGTVAKQASALETFRLTFDINFALVNMKSANDAMNDDTYVTGFGGAFTGIFDLGFAVTPFLYVGPRSGLVWCIPASFEHIYPAPELHPTDTINTKTNMDASMIPIEAGARLRFGVPFSENTSFSIGAFGGLCIVNVANNVDVTNPASQKASFVEKFSGIGLSGEISGALEFKLMKGVDFNVNAGYRAAGAAYVKQTEDAYYAFSGQTAVKVSSKDRILRNSAGTDISFDFSGLNFGVGISLGL
ncbi:MAG TPA: hypothetical protein P5511_07735 [Candidatus Goldiibacteriota bacterium]|nr:hypothetical protein [Candidatus Goldiibacteriota bacterium]